MAAGGGEPRARALAGTGTRSKHDPTINRQLPSNFIDLQSHHQAQLHQPRSRLELTPIFSYYWSNTYDSACRPNRNDPLAYPYLDIPIASTQMTIDLTPITTFVTDCLDAFLACFQV